MNFMADKVLSITALFLAIGLLIFVVMKRMTPDPKSALNPSLTQATLGESSPISTPTLTPTAQPVSPTALPTPTKTPGPPLMTTDPKKLYTAVLHTDKGDIEIALNAKATPITTNNFVFLARSGFYNGTPFHRVIKGFMIQGGDPKGNGSGGPGYKFNDEPITGAYLRGTVAMANSGPNTNGSQFFIMHADYPLPKNYVIFGNVIRGIEVVDAIASAPVIQGSNGENSTPVSPVRVITAEVVEK